MKTLLLLACVTVAYGSPLDQALASNNTTYGYIKRYAIPLAEIIRKAEEEVFSNGVTRTTDSKPALLGQFPYHAGILASYADVTSQGVCGGALISANRVVTAAHCWFDGVYQATLFQVVLGSIKLYSGGTRIDTSAVTVHSNWTPGLINNDVAVITVEFVDFSNTIRPIPLPAGSQRNDYFAADTGVASGFGFKSNDDVSNTSQFLSYVELDIITNDVCVLAYPLLLRPSNMCTRSIGIFGTCIGGSGGPLAVVRDNIHILVGITSFSSDLGCKLNLPTVYVRVTSFLNFINQNL